MFKPQFSGVLKVLGRIAILMAFFLGSMFLIAPSLDSEVGATELSMEALVELANQERYNRGLKPVKINYTLVKAASAKGKDMMKKHYWSHFGPNQESPWDFIVAAGYNYQYAGENLAKGFDTSEGTHRAWMNSPTHRDNILNPYFDEIGIAVLRGELEKGKGEVNLVVQMFGSKTKGKKVLSSTNIKESQLKILKPANYSIFKRNEMILEGIATNIEDNQVTYFINNQEKDSTKVDGGEGRFSFTDENGLRKGINTVEVKGVKTGLNETVTDKVDVLLDEDKYLESYWIEKIDIKIDSGALSSEKILIVVPDFVFLSTVELVESSEEWPISFSLKDDNGYIASFSKIDFNNIKQEGYIKLTYKDSSQTSIEVSKLIEQNDELAELLQTPEKTSTAIINKLRNLWQAQDDNLSTLQIGAIILIGIMLAFELVLFAKKGLIYKNRYLLIATILLLIVLIFNFIFGQGYIL